MQNATAFRKSRSTKSQWIGELDRLALLILTLLMQMWNDRESSLYMCMYMYINFTSKFKRERWLVPASALASSLPIHQSCSSTVFLSLLRPQACNTCTFLCPLLFLRSLNTTNIVTAMSTLFEIHMFTKLFRFNVWHFYMNIPNLRSKRLLVFQLSPAYYSREEYARKTRIWRDSDAGWIGFTSTRHFAKSLGCPFFRYNSMQSMNDDGTKACTGRNVEKSRHFLCPWARHLTLITSSFGWDAKPRSPNRAGCTTSRAIP